MESPLLKAVDFVKMGDINSARYILGLNDTDISDSNIVDSLMSFQKGYDYLLSGHHTKAFEPLRKSLPIIKKLSDSKAKFIVEVLANFSEGISKLFSGDVVGAYNLLNSSAKSLEKISFFSPDFVKVALSSKAAAEVALARRHLNIGDIGVAESLFGAIQQTYSELIAQLDEEDEKDLPFFVEAYAVQIEFVNTMATCDLSAIDFDTAEKRLISGEKLHADLIQLLPKIKNTPYKLVAELDCTLYAASKKIVKLGKKVINEKAFLQEVEIAELTEIDYGLFNARTLAHKAQDRGKVYLFIINQLSRFQERLLILGKIRKRDFINISGPISLISFIILLFSVHLTIHPSGYEAIPYFIGEIIVSLIVGFGYGALRFIPLIRLLTKAIEGKKDKINTSSMD